MSEKLYKKYLEKPESLVIDEVKAALDFRDAEPEAAHRIRARHEADRREAENREALKATWLSDGGDASRFEAAYKELSAERRKEKLAAVERDAKDASRRSMARSF